MTVVLTPPVGAPPRLRWTTDEFHATCDAGVFEGRNVILVDGEILEMPAPNPDHNSASELTRAALAVAFGSSFWVRHEMALDLSLDTDPVPDLAVVPGTPRTVRNQPGTALLVVEVSDSTLAYDRGEKSNLYAEGGIADYWVLDLNGRQLLVFRDLQPDPAAARGFAYRTRLILGPTDGVSPLAAPQASITVADLLP